jgi:hypothetical protein
LFFDLQGGRRGRIAAVGKERLRLEPGSVETFNDWKGFADVGPSGAVHFGFGVAARLGNMEVVSGTFMSAGRVRIIRGLKTVRPNWERLGALLPKDDPPIPSLDKDSRLGLPALRRFWS